VLLQRRLYNIADWEDIKQTVQNQLGNPPIIATIDDLDKATQELENHIQKLLQEKVPSPKVLPYTKRWWSRELTNLQKEYNHYRNQWTAAKRRGNFNPTLQAAVIKANRNYLAQIAKQKKNHWKEFLDDNQNVWKALAYLNNSSKTWTLPTLTARNRTYQEDKEKAELLLQTFFPPQPELQGGQEREKTTMEAEIGDPIGSRLEAKKVKRAIFGSNPRKALRLDNLSFHI